jgi:hypothetical protein
MKEAVQVAVGTSYYVIMNRIEANKFQMKH